MPAAETFTDLQSAYFGFELDGQQIGFFTKVSGLSLAIDTQDFVAVNAETEKRVRMKIPGHVKFPQIGLHRGLTSDMKLQDWLATTIDGKVERKTGAVVIYSREGEQKARFSFIGAYPSHMDISGFAAGDGGKPVIETLLIQHEGLLWD